MASTDHGDATVEKFAPNGGTVIAVLGALTAAGFIVGWALDTDRVQLWVPAVALFGAVLLYTSTVRPRVLVVGQELVLRNMLSTVHIPLAAIEELAVRQVLAVRAGGTRYVCAGVGRTMRQAMKGSAIQRAREEMGGLRGELEAAAVREHGMNYADFVELRIRELVNEDRTRRGVAKYSDEVEELARQVRREPAWPEIAAMVVSALLAAAAILAAR